MLEQAVEDKTLGYFKGCLTVRRLEFLSLESRTKVDKESSCGHAKQGSRYTISPEKQVALGHTGHGFNNSRPMSTKGWW